MVKSDSKDQRCYLELSHINNFKEIGHHEKRKLRKLWDSQRLSAGSLCLSAFSGLDLIPNFKCRQHAKALGSPGAQW